jgi:hypothetical protein
MNDPETRARRKAELRKLAEKLRAEGRPQLAREVMAFSVTTMSVNAPSKLARVRKLARREGAE